MTTTALHLIKNTSILEFKNSITGPICSFISVTGMVYDVPFVLPSSSGTSGDYLFNDGGGNSYWASSTSFYYPPVPNNDFYRTRTNELLFLNVVSGVSGNTGGIDTPGGLASATANINSVFIVTPTRYGSLFDSSSTAGTGSYFYRSNPRYTGIDRFSYRVVDSNGVTSLRTGMCKISIEANPPMGPSGASGPYFIYGTTSDSNVYQYSAGTTSTLFTASYPGVSGPVSGIASLATNRDDNLIYYTSCSGSTGYGNIYAYDYVNNYQFLLTNALSNPLFSGTAQLNFNYGSAVYNSSYLYIGQNATGATSYYQVNIGPYSYNGVTGVQSVYSTSLISVTGATMDAKTNASLSWDYQSANLFRMINSGSTMYYTVIHPESGLILTLQSTSIPPKSMQVTNPDCMNYLIVPGSNVVNYIRLWTTNMAVPPTISYTASVFQSLPTTTVSSLGEYINQPT